MNALVLLALVLVVLAVLGAVGAPRYYGGERRRRVEYDVPEVASRRRGFVEEDPLR